MSDTYADEGELKKETGKGWEEWINLLDEVGAKPNMSHKQIAELIFEKGYCDNTWWCQQIATHWQQKRGGQTNVPGV